MAYMISTTICNKCGVCVEECPVQAIKLDGDTYIIDPEDCTDCGACSDVCPEEAIFGL